MPTGARQNVRIQRSECDAVGPKHTKLRQPQEDSMPIARPTGAPGEYFENLGVHSGLLQRVMNAALARGGEDCDLYFQHSSSCSVQLSDEKVNQANTNVDMGMGVRVVVGDRWLRILGGTDRSIDGGCRPCRCGNRERSRRGNRCHSESGNDSRLHAGPKPWHNVDMRTRVEMVRKWEQAAFARNAEVKRVQAFLADAAQVVMIVRPDGRCLKTGDRPPSPLYNARPNVMAFENPLATTSQPGRDWSISRKTAKRAWLTSRSHALASYWEQANPQPEKCRWCWPRDRVRSCCMKPSAMEWRPTSIGKGPVSMRIKWDKELPAKTSPSSMMEQSPEVEAHSISMMKATQPSEPFWWRTGS